MKKFTTALAILGLLCFIWVIAHAFNWGSAQMERTHQDNIRWEMDWLSHK